jgi:hypothetical protein
MNWVIEFDGGIFRNMDLISFFRSFVPKNCEKYNSVMDRILDELREGAKRLNALPSTL